DLTCFLDAQLRVACNVGLPQQILQAVQGAVPGDVANTGDGIKRAYTEGGLIDPTRENYIVLITASDPVCNGMDPGYTIQEIAAPAALNPSSPAIAKATLQSRPDRPTSSSTGSNPT